eukprot:4959979-Pyramimonas_sp.AAC.1
MPFTCKPNFCPGHSVNSGQTVEENDRETLHVRHEGGQSIAQCVSSDGEAVQKVADVDGHIASCLNGI